MASPSVVDSVGGVDLCVPRDMKDKKAGIDLKKGCQTLDGGNALGYVRSRYEDPLGDIGRAARQRQFLGALMKKAATPSTVLLPWRYKSFADASAAGLAVGQDTGITDAVRVLQAMRAVSNDEGLSLSVPTSDLAYRTSAGALAVKWDTERAKALFKALKDDEPLTEPPAGTTVEGAKNSWMTRPAARRRARADGRLRPGSAAADVVRRRARDPPRASASSSAHASSPTGSPRPRTSCRTTPRPAPAPRSASTCPAHWRSLYWALATWSVGATVVVGDAATGADVLVTDSPAAAAGHGGDAVLVSLPALARRHPEADDAGGAVDEARELADPRRRLLADVRPRAGRRRAGRGRRRHGIRRRRRA